MHRRHLLMGPSDALQSAPEALRKLADGASHRTPAKNNGESRQGRWAKSVLRDLIGTKKKIVSMDDIQETVGARFHVKIADLKSRRRSKTLVYPRQIAMYLCRELTDSSYPEIGRQFGGKDHTTIIHACKQVIKAKNSDSALSATLDSLKEQILRA